MQLKGEETVAVRKVRSDISPKISRIQRKLRRVPDRAYTFFKSVTPIRTGNARRRTSLRGNVIEANYPYATRLDQGWSKQAPNGMVQPTIDYIKRLVRGIFGR